MGLSQSLKAPPVEHAGTLLWHNGTYIFGVTNTNSSSAETRITLPLRENVVTATGVKESIPGTASRGLNDLFEYTRSGHYINRLHQIQLLDQQTNERNTLFIDEINRSDYEQLVVSASRISQHTGDPNQKYPFEMKSIVAISADQICDKLTSETPPTLTGVDIHTNQPVTATLNKRSWSLLREAATQDYVCNCA